MDQSYRGKRTLREGRSFEEPVLQYTRNTSLGAIHLRVGVVETRVKQTAFLPLPTRYSFYFVYAFFPTLKHVGRVRQQRAWLNARTWIQLPTWAYFGTWPWSPGRV